MSIDFQLTLQMCDFEFKKRNQYLQNASLLCSSKQVYLDPKTEAVSKMAPNYNFATQQTSAIKSLIFLLNSKQNMCSYRQNDKI